MKITLWGVRGSIPTPIASQAIEEKIVSAILGMPNLDTQNEVAVRDYVRSLAPLERGTAGGNTTCVEIRSGNDVIIIDAGSGLRDLGNELMKGPWGKGKGSLHFVFTHAHWDHIQGFPFFTPAFIPGNKLYFYSVHDIQDALEGQQRSLTFPVPLSYLKAAREFIHIEPGEEFTIGNLKINSIENVHPGKAYSFRFEDGHSTFVFACDAEYKNLSDAGLQPYIDFFRNADALVFDAQYTLREAWQKVDWGHSSALIGMDLARRAGVKKLLLCHHDPTYSDSELLGIQAAATAYQDSDPSLPTCEAVIAYEGLTLDLMPTGAVDIRLASGSDLAILTPLEGKEGVEQAIQQLAALDPKLGVSSPILDLSYLDTLSTADLQALIALHQRWRESAIVLVTASEKVRQVIEIAGYQDYFVIYPNLEVAVSAVKARQMLNLPGQVVYGRYLILKRIHNDPWIPVLLALDQQTKEQVALKMISPSFSAARIERLLQHIERFIGLDHPHMVKILGWGREGEYIFLVEEYIEADTLHSLLLGEAVLAERSGVGKDDEPENSGLEQEFRLAEGLIQALEFLHGLGLTHGGFSPRNIFVTSEGVKLGGFGLGHLIEGHDLLNTPVFLLPVSHLSPEHIVGQVLDARSDLYSLGVMLYQLFTGRLPFTGSEQAVKDAHLSLAPEAIRERHPQVSPSLEHMILRLLAKNPNNRYASASQVRRIWEGLGASVELVSSSRWKHFVGRAEQLDFFETAWQEVLQGQGRLVFICGEAGVGKTSLAQQVALSCQAPVVLFSRAQRGDAHTYQLFRDLLLAYLATIPPELFVEETRQLLQNLARVVPEINQYLPQLHAPPLLAPEQEQLRLMTSLMQFFRKATQERRWLVILDDLQWVDQSSLELLGYIIRHFPALPMLLVGIYSEDELDQDDRLRDLLGDLSRNPAFHAITLDRLDQRGVMRMLTELWESEVPPDLAEVIFHHTQGNPFFVEEIAKSLIDDGSLIRQEGKLRFPGASELKLPASVHEVVWRRISRLNSDTQNILHHAAVLGPTFRFEILQEMVNLPEWEVLKHLDMALERQLIQEVPGENVLAFRQMEIQRVLYDDLGPLRRRILHRQAGEILEKHLAVGLEHMSAELAYHFSQAGEYPRALFYSLQAAQLAKLAYANENAVLWYERALEILTLLTPDVQMSFQHSLLEAHKNIGEVLMLLGKYDEVLSHANVFFSVAGTASDRSELFGQMADMCRLVAEVHENRGDYQAAHEWLQKGLTYIPQDHAGEETARIYNLLGLVYIRIASFDRALPTLKQALELSEDLHLTSLQVASLRLMGSASWYSGDFEGAQSYWERSLQISREIGDWHGEGRSLNNLGLLHVDMGTYEKADQSFIQALQIAHDTGDRWFACTTLNNLGWLNRLLGNFEQARSFLDEGLKISQEIGARQPETLILSNLSMIAHAMGAPETGLVYAHKAIRNAREMGIRHDLATYLTRLGGMLIATGDFNQALQCFEESLNLRKELGQPSRTLDAQSGSAYALLKNGSLPQALAQVEEVLPKLNERFLSGSDNPQVVLLNCFRVLEAAQDARATGVLQQAREWLERIERKFSNPQLAQEFRENSPWNRAIISSWSNVSQPGPRW